MSKSLLTQVPSLNILEGLSWQFSDKHGGELTPKKHVFQNTEPYQNND